MNGQVEENGEVQAFEFNKELNFRKVEPFKLNKK